MSNHLVKHILNPALRSDNTLHVIGVVSNPVMFNSRYRLAREWIKAMEATPNVKVYVVEAAFGDRHFEVTDSHNPQHLQLRTKSEIWIKENMINLGVRRLLPRDWKYVAWIDADVHFRNPNWAQESLHQLQHFPIIQPWQTAINMGPTGNVMKSFPSAGHQISKGISPFKDGKYTGDPYIYGHCGYAWACTRSFYEGVAGLIDFAILGSADHHMSNGCRGIYSHSVHSAMPGPFMELCHEWQNRAMRLTHGVVGYANGTVEHMFHGNMARRNYVGRWEILVKNKFSPKKDLTYDAQGLIQLVGKPQLELDIRAYNRERREDAVYED